MIEIFLRYRKPLYFLLLLSISLHLYSTSTTGKSITYYFLTVAGYPIKFVSSFMYSIREFAGKVYHLLEIEREMEAREREISSLRREILSLKNMLVKYAEIEKMMNKLKNYRDFDRVFCNIIGSSRNDAILYLDCGKDEGVDEGDGVVGEYGIVGRISATGKNFSTVITILNSDFAVDCFTLHTRVRGILKGSSDSRLRMIYIDPYTPVEKDEPVITLGYDRSFPEGIGVGKIIEVKKGADGITKEGVVEPFVRIKNLYIVTVFTRKE